jgi:hypothetical protein
MSLVRHPSAGGRFECGLSPRFEQLGRATERQVLAGNGKGCFQFEIEEWRMFEPANKLLRLDSRARSRPLSGTMMPDTKRPKSGSLKMAYLAPNKKIVYEAFVHDMFSTWL